MSLFPGRNILPITLRENLSLRHLYFTDFRRVKSWILVEGETGFEMLGQIIQRICSSATQRRVRYIGQRQ